MEGFAIIEQMGHKRLVGRVSEAEVCGVKMLRVETLTEPPEVQIVHPQTFYAITPCTEEQARRAGEWIGSPLVNLGARPNPIIGALPERTREPAARPRECDDGPDEMAGSDDGRGEGLGDLFETP